MGLMANSSLPLSASLLLFIYLSHGRQPLSHSFVSVLHFSTTIAKYFSISISWPYWGTLPFVTSWCHPASHLRKSISRGYYSSLFLASGSTPSPLSSLVLVWLLGYSKVRSLSWYCTTWSAGTLLPHPYPVKSCSILIPLLRSTIGHSRKTYPGHAQPSGRC